MRRWCASRRPAGRGEVLAAGELRAVAVVEIGLARERGDRHLVGAVAVHVGERGRRRCALARDRDRVGRERGRLDRPARLQLALRVPCVHAPVGLRRRAVDLGRGLDDVRLAVAVDVADRGRRDDPLAVLPVARLDRPAREALAAAVPGVDLAVGRPDDDVELAAAVELGERRARVDRGVALRAGRAARVDPDREAADSPAVVVPGVDTPVERRRDDLGAAAPAMSPTAGVPRKPARMRPIRRAALRVANAGRLRRGQPRTSLPSCRATRARGRRSSRGRSPSTPSPVRSASTGEPSPELPSRRG